MAHLSRFTQVAAAVVLTAALAHAAAAEVHTWTDATGTFSREGTFTRIDGDRVVIRGRDGRTFTVPLERLSTADQAFARKTAAAEGDPFQDVAEQDPEPPRSDTAIPTASPATGGDTRVVIAQGVGTTVEAAKKDAYREAVRQVVGAYVESDTLVKNDSLIEDKILTLSGGFVEQADVLADSVVTRDGQTRLRVRAVVRVTEVMKQLGRLNITTTAVRSGDMEGQVETMAGQRDAAELALGDARAWAAVPASFFVLKPAGQPKVVKARGDDATVELLLTISPNRDQYMAFAKRLAAVLSKLGGPSGGFTVDGRNPDCDQRGLAEARTELWRHVLVSSFNRGNLAEPEISYAFPETCREPLQAHFEEMATALPTRSQCQVYCFNQDAGRQPHGCGLAKAAREWYAAIGRKRDELMVICLVTQMNDAGNRTKWDWFTCEQSLFPGGDESPWLRGIELEVTLLDAKKAEIAVDILPLSGGFGISRDDFRYYPPVVMLAPAWIETEGEAEYRYAYVPQFTFPRRIELTKDEAAAIAEVKCVVRPRLNALQ